MPDQGRLQLVATPHEVVRELLHMGDVRHVPGEVTERLGPRFVEDDDLVVVLADAGEHHVPVAGLINTNVGEPNVQDVLEELHVRLEVRAVEPEVVLVARGDRRPLRLNGRDRRKRLDVRGVVIAGILHVDDLHLDLARGQPEPAAGLEARLRCAEPLVGHVVVVEACLVVRERPVTCPDRQLLDAGVAACEHDIEVPV